MRTTEKKSIEGVNLKVLTRELVDAIAFERGFCYFGWEESEESEESDEFDEWIEPPQTSVRNANPCMPIFMYVC